MASQKLLKSKLNVTKEGWAIRKASSSLSTGGTMFLIKPRPIWLWKQNGVVMKKSDDGNDGLISNKKPRKARQAKSMLYGCFVKSATLLSGEEQSEKTSESDDRSSSSEDEDQNLDLSSTTKLSDTDLLKACGGRTAHKGARHGLTMSAKLARLEQQEQEFMIKYGKKNHTAETSTSNTDCLYRDGHPDIKEKTKRKKSKRQEEPSENNIHEDKMTTGVLSSYDTEDGKPKKRKESNDASVNHDLIANSEPKRKKKRNRKEKAAPEDRVDGDCSIDVNEAFTHTSEEQDTHLPTDDSMHKKKKKKRFKVAAEMADADEISEESTDAHRKQLQEDSTEYQQTSDNTFKKKKKKKSSTTENSTTAMRVTEDASNEAQIMDTQTEGQENERKKNKKMKRSKKE
ncbi:G patch domain-containing protein 4 isoform X3 [Carassius auratus]|uniref:G patch domain-containing protein 4-like isoform X3 n=1 Tax=Carassius auratus TaxID=7957 RepID=A0A6P6LF38_CARAU|nr:G patch domain-containing protein 4-like isoform X3 [Carassius auratus]XP_026083204.1 G patch domain-containing protein 4-like isoform X3 [Carassius auratus]